MKDQSNNTMLHTGFKWLTHILKSNDDDHDDNPRMLSQPSKIVLEHLLRENKVYDIDADSCNQDDDEEEDDDEQGYMYSIGSSSIQKSDFDFLLFPTLLKVVHDLYQQLNNETSSTSASTTNTTNSPIIPTTKEIIQSFTSLIKSSSLSSKILPPSHIPSSLNSNQFIFAALLFLSDDTLQKYNDTITDTDHKNNNNNNMTLTFPSFPKMPLLTKHIISTKATSSSSSKKTAKSIIPYGFEINQEIMMISSSLLDMNLTDIMNMSMDMENEYDSTLFRKQLSSLESYFWSMSCNNVEHVPRVHVIPKTKRGNGADIGLFVSEEDEHNLMVLGSIEGTIFDKKTKVQEAIVHASKSTVSIHKKSDESRKSKSKKVKRKINDISKTVI
jgi:hypothetical protein